MQAVLVQAIGFVGAVLIIISFQCKRSQRLILLQMCSNACFMVQFIFLGGFTGSLTLLISIVRNLVLYNHTKKWAKWRGWLPLLIIAYIAAVVFTWADVFSILPCIAMITATIGSWARNGRMIRMANLCVSCPCWIIYDLHTFSIAGVLQEAFMMGSVLVSFVRYGWKGLDGDGEAVENVDDEDAV